MDEVRALIGGLSRFKSVTVEKPASSKAEQARATVTHNHSSDEPVFWDDALVYIPAEEWQIVDHARQHSIVSLMAWARPVEGGPIYLRGFVLVESRAFEGGDRTEP